MNWLKQLVSRRRLYGDLSEEIREHLEEKVEGLVRNGMSPEDAEFAARREFGNVSLTEERARDVWRWPTVENLLNDIRYGFRMLRNNPGFSVVAIVTLALGIGANTAIFSVVDRALIRPLPYWQPNRLITVTEVRPQEGKASESETPITSIGLANPNPCSPLPASAVTSSRFMAPVSLSRFLPPKQRSIFSPLWASSRFSAEISRLARTSRRGQKSRYSVMAPGYGGSAATSRFLAARSHSTVKASASSASFLGSLNLHRKATRKSGCRCILTRIW